MKAAVNKNLFDEPYVAVWLTREESKNWNSHKAELMAEVRKISDEHGIDAFVFGSDGMCLGVHVRKDE